MAISKLNVNIDNLSHKILSITSEIAVGENFNIDFCGVSEWDAQSTTVSVGMCDAMGNMIWTAEGLALEKTDAGFSVAEDLTIDTAEALDATGGNVGTVYLSLCSSNERGELAFYGISPMRLHAGAVIDGTNLSRYVSEIAKHNDDPNAHPAMFEAVTDSLGKIAEACADSASAASGFAETAGAAAKAAVVSMSSASDYAKAAKETAESVSAKVEEATSSASDAKADAERAEAAAKAAETTANDIVAAKDSAVQAASDSESYAQAAALAAQAAEEAESSVSESIGRAEQAALQAESAKESALQSAQGSESAKAESAKSAAAAADSEAAAKASAQAAADDAAEAEAAKTAAAESAAATEGHAASAAADAAAAEVAAASAEGIKSELSSALEEASSLGARVSALESPTPLRRRTWLDGLFYSDNYNEICSAVKLDANVAKVLLGVSNIGVQVSIVANYNEWLVDISQKGWVLVDRDFTRILAVYSGQWVQTSYYGSRKTTAIGRNHIVAALSNCTPQYSGLMVSTRRDGTLIATRTVAPDEVSEGFFKYFSVVTNDDLFVLAGRFLVDPETLDTVGEIALEDGLTLTGSNIGVFSDYISPSVAYTAIPEGWSPIHCVGVSGVNGTSEPLWLDDRFTLDESGRAVPTWRRFRDVDGAPIVSKVTGDGAIANVMSSWGQKQFIRINQEWRELSVNLEPDTPEMAVRVSKKGFKDPILKGTPSSMIVMKGCNNGSHYPSEEFIRLAQASETVFSGLRVNGSADVAAALTLPAFATLGDGGVKATGASTWPINGYCRDLKNVFVHKRNLF